MLNFTMKISVLVFAFFIAQTNASFFDEFRGAMVSVEEGFGKLLSDVVTDVKETIDCAIVAVEHVLSFGGIFGTPADDDRCSGGTQQPAKTYDTSPPPPQSDTPSEKPYIVKNESKNRDTDSNPNHSSNDDLSKQITNSISNVNKTIANILDKHDAQMKLENVKNVLKNETDRIAEASVVLRQELENISQTVKEEFQKIDLQHQGLTKENLWSDIKFLHEIEKNDKNKSEAVKIRKVLDDVLKLLHADGLDLPLEDDMKEIVKELQDDSVGVNEPNSSQESGRLSVGIINIEAQITPQVFHKTFKEVNDKILKKVDKPESTSSGESHLTSLVSTFPKKFEEIKKKVLAKARSSEEEGNNEKIDDDARQSEKISEELPTIFNRVSKTASALSSLRSNNVKEESDTEKPNVFPKAFTDVSKALLKDETDLKATIITTGTEEEPSVKPTEAFPETYKDLTKRLLEETSEQPHSTNTESLFPKTFKDVAKSDFAQADASRGKEGVTQENNDKASSVMVDPTTTKENKEEPFDYNSLFNFDTSSKQAAESAKKVMQKSEHSQALLDKIFNDDVGVSLFDNPDLLAEWA